MTGGNKHRFVALDSLRGICACMVVLYHFDTIGRISQSTLVQNSFLFVDFFFVLSGFVIAASYGDRISSGYSIRKFMLLRLGRVYPLHIVVLAFFVIFEFATMNIARSTGHQPWSGNYSFGALLANLGLVQPFFGSDGTSWNGPAWSIAVEVWTYLVFALGFRMLGRFVIPTALVLAIGCACYLFVATDRYLNVFHDGAFARCLFGFSLGVVIFWMHRRLKLTINFWLATLLELAAVLATVLIVAYAGASVLSLTVPLVFAAVMLTFAQQSGAVSRLLVLRPFEFLGKISYSIYMVHLFIVLRTYNALEIGQRAFGTRSIVTTIGERKFAGTTPLMGDLLSLAVLVGIIATSAITYKFVEYPANQWVRRKVSSRKAE